MSLRSDIAGRKVRIAFPQHLAAASMPLLIAERAEFEAVFGAPVAFVAQVPEHGPRWIVAEEPDAPANRLHWDAHSLTLTSTVRDAAGFVATLQLLHSLVALEVDFLSDAPADDMPSSVSRIMVELECGFPGFAIRGLDWHEIRSLYPPNNDMTIDDLQRLVARLQDGHTAVRQTVPVYNPPYVVECTTQQFTLLRVPEWSQGAQAGIQAGWCLQIPDAQAWLDYTGSPPHSRALVAGRRAVALNGVAERAFTAISPEGESRSWVEQSRPFSVDQLLDAHVVADDIVYLRLQNWITGVGLEERLNHLLQIHAHRSMLVLDVRGNTGGNLVMAQQFRRRFLRERTLLGTIRFTRGDGTLADPVELWDQPDEATRWPGQLIVLTDSLTYSASEDFLHGLQGLSHVTVIGQASGGGSGRPRTVPIVPGWVATISTALTFDRQGRCIEGKGVPVDIACDPFTESWRDIVMAL